MDAQPCSWADIRDARVVSTASDEAHRHQHAKRHAALRRLRRDQARPYNFALSPVLVNVTGMPITLPAPFEKDSSRWLDMPHVNIHDGTTHTLRNPTSPIPVQTFEMVFHQYHRHPESKSFAPDGAPCKADTTGLLQRAHVIAGEIRYVGKETDRKWEEGEDASVLEFTATEYGRKTRVVASEEVKNAILGIGINKCARESRFDRKNFIRKLVRGLPVKRNTYQEFARWLRGQSAIPATNVSGN